MIRKCNLKVRSTGVAHKCDEKVRLSHESEVCKFAGLQVCRVRKFTSSKACAQKTQKIQKSHFNESGQFDNECSTINWCPGLNEP